MVMKTLVGFISPQFIVSSSRVGLVFYDRKKELHELNQAVETCFHSQSELVFNELLHDGMDIREQFSPFIYFFIWAQTLILNQCFVIIIYKPSFFPFIQ